MSASTFAESYCRKHQIPAEQFDRKVLAHGLYPHARFLAPIVRAFRPDHFAADLDLVRGVGQLRRVRDFSIEALDYSHHPANQGGLRRILRIRVSTQRLRRLVAQTLHDPAASAFTAGTEVPFSSQDSAAKSPADQPRHS